MVESSLILYRWGEVSLVLQLSLRYRYPFFADLPGETVSMECEIVRVVSLGTREDNTVKNPILRVYLP